VATFGTFCIPKQRSCSCRAVQICKALAKPEVVPGDVLGASNHLIAAPLCELGPAMRGQILGVIGGHLDGAIGLDVEVPPRKGLHRPGVGRGRERSASSRRRSGLRIALGLHPGVLEVALARERALEPIQLPG
jgi:hypothetical protein